MHGTPYRISLVGIPKHVVTTISDFSFIMLLLDIILTHIVNHLSNTSYHLQYLYCPGAKPNLITCVVEIFLSEGLEDRLLSALEIGNGVWRIKDRKIFSSKYMDSVQGIYGTLVEYQRLTPKGCKFEPKHDLFRNTIFVSCGIRLTTQIVCLLSDGL
jgi:hypothetical protein